MKMPKEAHPFRCHMFHTSCKNMNTSSVRQYELFEPNIRFRQLGFNLYSHCGYMNYTFINKLIKFFQLLHGKLFRHRYYDDIISTMENAC
jgi:hypothetical protein